MKISLIIIMISLQVFLFANIQGQDLKIKLKSIKIELADRDFIIVKTIDARKNKMMLGTVKRGLKNRSRIASLHKGLEYQFNGFLAQSMPAIENHKYEILLVVRELTVAETSYRFNEAARVFAIYDFYIAISNHYKMLYRCRQFLKSTNAINATSAHDRLISETICNALNEFDKSEWRLKMDEIIEENYKEMIEPRSFEYPVLSLEKPTKGIYMNLDQFRQNEPVFTNFNFFENNEKNTARLESSGGKFIVSDDLGNARKITTQIWGFSTGEKIYIKNSNGYFTLLIRKDDHFFFEDFVRLPDVSNNQVVESLVGEYQDYAIFELDIKTGEFIFIGR